MAIDFSNLNTGQHVRRTSPEDLEASRKRAAGAPAPERGRSPEFAAWAKSEIESRFKRTLMGPPIVGGNHTFYTLSHAQFAEHLETGAWTGDPAMPTEEDANRPDPKPDHREWTPIKEA